MGSGRIRIFFGFSLGFALLGAATFARADCRSTLAYAIERPGYYLSQNDPTLMRVYGNADFLCGPTCVANAFRLAELVSPASKKKPPFGLVELRRYVDSLGELGVAFADGTSAFDLGNALGGISKRARENFDVDLISTYPLTGSPKELKARAPWIAVRGKRKILPELVTKDDYDFFVLGYVGLDSRGRRRKVGHFTIGVYEPEMGKIKMLDPTHPDENLYYSIEKRPGSDGSLRISRTIWSEREGDEITREYLVDEILGFRLKRRPTIKKYRPADHNPLLDANTAVAQAFAPFLVWSCSRQKGIPVCYAGASQLMLEEVLAAKRKAKSIHAQLRPHPKLPDAFYVEGHPDWVLDAADVDEFIAAVDRI